MKDGRSIGADRPQGELPGTMSPRPPASGPPCMGLPFISQAFITAMAIFWQWVAKYLGEGPL